MDAKMSIALLLIPMVAFSAATASHKSCNETNPLTGCEEVFGTECSSNGTCVCSPSNELEEEGHCLKSMPTIYGRCWVSSQCQVQGSKCSDERGNELTLIDANNWGEFVGSNGSDYHIPGQCRCLGNYMRYDYEANACIPRNLGSSCKTSYECSRRMAFSQCSKNRCYCALEAHYKSELDECVFNHRPVNPLICVNGSCDKTPETLLKLLFSETYGNATGFFICMACVSIVWLFCFCVTRSRRNRSKRLQMNEGLNFSAIEPYVADYENHYGLVSVPSLYGYEGGEEGRRRQGQGRENGGQREGPTCSTLSRFPAWL